MWNKLIIYFIYDTIKKSKIHYPLFDDYDLMDFGSILLRNSGEDPKGVRIMDAALTRVLKDEMDLDYQQYKPVVLYINP